MFGFLKKQSKDEKLAEQFVSAMFILGERAPSMVAECLAGLGEDRGLVSTLNKKELMVELPLALIGSTVGLLRKTSPGRADRFSLNLGQAYETVCGSELVESVYRAVDEYQHLEPVKVEELVVLRCIRDESNLTPSQRKNVHSAIAMVIRFVTMSNYARAGDPLTSTELAVGLQHYSTLTAM